MEPTKGLAIRLIDTEDRLLTKAMAAELPQGAARMLKRSLKPISLVDVEPKDVAEALKRGQADFALVQEAAIPGLVAQGALAELAACGGEVLQDGIVPFTLQGRLYGIMAPISSNAILVASPMAIESLRALGNLAARLVETLRGIIEWLALLNIAVLTDIQAVAGTPESPQARCADFDFKYQVSWFTINAEVTDVTWTKTAPAGAPIQLRTTSSANPGPVKPMRPDGTPAYAHRQVNQNNTSRYEVPM